MTACLLLVVSSSASAQFNNAVQDSKSKKGAIFTKDTKNYNFVYAGYSHIFVENLYDIDMNGFTLGYAHGFNLTKSLPLFLEAGANFQASYGGFVFDGYYGDGSLVSDLDYSLYSLNIPVHVAYKFSFLDNLIGVTPFIGLNFRVHLSGKVKDTRSNHWESESKSYDLFDEDEMKAFDDQKAFNRFQMGLNVGVKLNYKKYVLGLCYTTDFMPIVKNDLYVEDLYVGEVKAETGVMTISLGYNF